MDAVLGLDTSCYTTSAAAVDAQGQVIAFSRLLLPVEAGQRGLRVGGHRFFAAAVPMDAPPQRREGLAVDSSALLQGQKAVTILHNGAIYRLQATKLGKLILTK